jgi:hypothetical protein
MYERGVNQGMKKRQPEIDELKQEVVDLKADRDKERIFVEHIKGHLKHMNVGAAVVCKICARTIDEIYEETIK